MGELQGEKQPKFGTYTKVCQNIRNKWNKFEVIVELNPPDINAKIRHWPLPDPYLSHRDPFSIAVT